MQVIVVLIGFSLLVAVGFLVAFLWAVRSGQYDDDVSPGMRMLFDDKKPESSKQPTNNQTTA
jgi:cbb3-type cytochrome oxidase maturation protein